MEELYKDFAIKSEIVKGELEILLEKTKKVEWLLREAIRQEVSETDLYRPDLESTINLPPKKKMRIV
jgi:hypothetical protein